MTAIFVVSGLAIPALLAHIKVIQVGAFLMSVSGGIIVYATILVRFHLWEWCHSTAFNKAIRAFVELLPIWLLQASCAPPVTWLTLLCLTSLIESDSLFVRLPVHPALVIQSSSCTPSTARRKKPPTKCIRCMISRIFSDFRVQKELEVVKRRSKEPI